MMMKSGLGKIFLKFERPKDDLLSRPYLIKKTTRGGRWSKMADFETT